MLGVCGKVPLEDNRRECNLKLTKTLIVLQQVAHKAAVTGRQRNLTPRQTFYKEFLQVLVKKANSQADCKQKAALSCSNA